MKRAWVSLVSFLAGLSFVAHAHNAICDCYDNGDDTVTCEGGFTDGGAAVGVAMRVLDDSGKLLIEGVMGDNSDFTFSKPAGNYQVEFDGGEGHLVQIDGRDIEE
jgi:uncharacterized Rossmann fold enzyme